MTGAIFFTHWNWQKLFSVGEVLCFVSAWAIGLLIASDVQRPEQDRSAARTFAATSDSLGIQATLRR